MGAYEKVSAEAARATLAYLRACCSARAAGVRVAYTTDPAWLLDMAINRKAGWPDDPSTSRGSAMPVNGRYPARAYDSTLRQLAYRINTPRLIVRAGELGSWRRLLPRLAHRITTPEEE